MKNILAALSLLMSTLFVFGQDMNPLGFIETKIESGSTFKKYKSGKLDSIIVTMAAVNYGNALIFSKLKDEIRITNAADKNSVIKIELKNKKQLRTFFYKNKPAIIVENVDFDINNLPKNVKISNGISNGIINSYTLITNYESFGNDNPDKTFKLFYRLDIRSDLDNLDAIFENIGNFLSKEDALLKLFSGKYAEKSEPQSLAYLETDASGKIKNGIYLDFKNKKNIDKNSYSIYKDGKIIKSGTANLADFQTIFMNYREKSIGNK